ncbi:MAG: TIGR00730 family Rossman fold protein [Actinomycetota bacterium]|nr:TIGR00730 family Rossman fold protein [Actinomycetota bacterium]MEC9058296.1 TIGR00730 family Rossman fold protein [Actinomycetota bacterium]
MSRENSLVGSVAVFCASSLSNQTDFPDLAAELGEHLADHGITVVFGGSDAGLMGVVAQAAISRGGNVVGIYPEDTFSRDVRHHGEIDLRLVSSMHERKSEMFRLCDAAVALPGGLGTLDEVIELLLWTHLGIHQLPVVLLDQGSFWDKFLEFLDEASESGVLNSTWRQFVTRTSEPKSVLRILEDLKGQMN